MPSGFAEFFLPELLGAGAKGFEGGLAGLVQGQEYRQKASAAALDKLLKELQQQKLEYELRQMGLPQFQQLTPGAAYGQVSPGGTFQQQGVAPFPKTEYEWGQRIEQEIAKERGRSTLEWEKQWNRSELERQKMEARLDAAIEKAKLGLTTPHGTYEQRVLEEYATLPSDQAREMWKRKNPVKGRMIEDYFAGKEKESLAAGEEITTGQFPNVTKRRVTPQQLKQLDHDVAGYVQLFEEKKVTRAQADALLKKPGLWLEKEAIKRAIQEYFGR